MEQLNIFLQNKEVKKKSRSEREEIIEILFQKLEKSWAEGQELKKTRHTFNQRFLNWKTSHLKLPDLYYMKSVLEDAENRGQNPAKLFWSLLKVKSNN